MNCNEILNRLKDLFSQEVGDRKIFDKNIAQVLWLKYDTFRKKKSRGDISYFEIMGFLAKRKSINWFFFNQLQSL